VPYGGYQIVARFKSFSLAFDFAFLLLILLVSKKSQNRTKNSPTKKHPPNKNQLPKNYAFPTNPKQPKANAKKKAKHPRARLS
jgi:hypothetical protein